MAIPIAFILAAGQAILGAVQKGKANKAAKAAQDRQDSLLAQRKTYKTPSEIYQALQAVTNRAQSGYDAETLNYLTSQTDRAFSSNLATQQYLGGDPNSFAASFDQQLNQIMKIGAENHAVNMQNFNNYINALDVVGKSKDAEWQSSENLIKDQLQSAQAQRANAVQDSANATNTIINAIGNGILSTYYNSANAKLDSDGMTASQRSNAFKTAYGDQGQWDKALKYANQNGMSYSEYSSANKNNINTLANLNLNW